MMSSDIIKSKSAIKIKIQEKCKTFWRHNTIRFERQARGNWWVKRRHMTFKNAIKNLGLLINKPNFEEQIFHLCSLFYIFVNKWHL